MCALIAYVRRPRRAAAQPIAGASPYTVASVKFFEKVPIGALCAARAFFQAATATNRHAILVHASAGWFFASVAQRQIVVAKPAFGGASAVLRCRGATHIGSRRRPRGDAPIYCFVGTRALSSSNQLRTTRNSGAPGLPDWISSEVSMSPRILPSGVRS